MKKKNKKDIKFEKESHEIADNLVEGLNWGVMRDHIEYVELGISKLDEDYFKALKMRENKEKNQNFICLTSNIKKAIKKAASLHHEQFRKGEDRKVPFLSHLLSVGEILAKYTKDENIIISGILHDALEDGKENNKDYTIEKLKEEFGNEVSQIVQEVTEDMELKRKFLEKKSWKKRKEKYIEHLDKASKPSLMVCCADKIHNLRSMRKAYELQGKKLWDKFNAKPEEIKWFYKTVLKTLKKNLNNNIVSELEELYKNTSSIFGKKIRKN